MSRTFAFDVYGTLIDPYGIVAKLETIVGDAAISFATTWREKQLEYTFRRAAMHAYEDFVVCTKQALDYTALNSGITLAAADRDELMSQYRKLPAYLDAEKALLDLKSAGHRLYAFSNGHPDDLSALLEHAGLAPLLEGIVSVHHVQSFKPDPAVYQHFLKVTDTEASDCWLVSGNSFDILGARACGWCTAWVRRDERILFDPWESEPNLVVTDLTDLAAAV